MKKKTAAAFFIMITLTMSLASCASENSLKRSVVEEYASQQDKIKRKGLGSIVENMLSKDLGAYDASGDIPVTCTECEWEGDFQPPFFTEEYAVLDEHGFQRVLTSPLSTFSADVDTASYSNLRRFIEDGYRIEDIPKGAVRTEELINYFNYDYKLPNVGEPFGVTTKIGVCPWNPESSLVSIGIRTEKIDFSEAPSSNIVFLIDVSGSMFSDEKLPLLVRSFKLMLRELGEKDRVSIVTYAGEDKILLEGVPGSEKEKIEEVLDSLEANGSTNGGRGIISAYKLAESCFIKGGNNRVILATDGDLNVGITNASDLEELIKEEAQTGIFLTVLGFGMGNYSDERMEVLADRGNGNYAYIDSIDEARKVLCEQLGATMVTVAKDVKFQVEFNPAIVSQYRLIGYEDRTMAAEDFDDDTKDAGEIGAGHMVTAMYEIITVKGDTKNAKELKYQSSRLTQEALESDEWMTVSIRYKEPNEDISRLLAYPVGKSDYMEKSDEDFLFAACVAEFAQIVREEEYVNEKELADVIATLEDLNLTDQYRVSFVNLVRKLADNERTVSYHENGAIYTE